MTFTIIKKGGNNMYIYAQIDEDGRCYAISQLGCEVERERLVRIDGFDSDYLGKRYADGKWIDE
jgi:hypothetical protein